MNIKICVRPALLYAAETWELRERLEGLLAVVVVIEC